MSRQRAVPQAGETQATLWAPCLPSPGIKGRPCRLPGVSHLSEPPSPRGSLLDVWSAPLPPWHLIFIKREAGGIQDTSQEVCSSARSVLLATISDRPDKTHPQLSPHGLGHTRNPLRPSAAVDRDPIGEAGGWRASGWPPASPALAACCLETAPPSALSPLLSTTRPASISSHKAPFRPSPVTLVQGPGGSPGDRDPKEAVSGVGQVTPTSPHLTPRPLAHLESQATQEAPRPDHMTRDTAIQDRRSSPQASPEGQKRRLGPASAPWWEARGREGRSACRASPIGARSRLQPPRPRPLLASLGHGFSPLPASLGNALLRIRKRHLHCPKAARLGTPATPSTPAWRPGAPACLAPPLLSPPLPKSLV